MRLRRFKPRAPARPGREDGRPMTSVSRSLGDVKDYAGLRYDIRVRAMHCFQGPCTRVEYHASRNAIRAAAREGSPLVRTADSKRARSAGDRETFN